LEHVEKEDKEYNSEYKDLIKWYRKEIPLKTFTKAE